MTGPAQRLRLTFACDDALRYISHLDLMRTWERVLKRAGLPVTQSQGFTQRPRIALAAPLSVGGTSECEQLDLLLDDRLALSDLSAAVRAQLPRGLRLLEVETLPEGLPSLQSLLRATEYLVDVPDARSAEAIRCAITALLARETLSWEHARGDEIKRYDLRRLIYEIELLSAADGRARLRMRLRHDETGAGRPEQVSRALGMTEPPERIHRTRLELAQPAIAREARRAAGRPDG